MLLCYSMMVEDSQLTYREDPGYMITISLLTT